MEGLHDGISSDGDVNPQEEVDDGYSAKERRNSPTRPTGSIHNGNLEIVAKAFARVVRTNLEKILQLDSDQTA